MIEIIEFNAKRQGPSRRSAPMEYTQMGTENALEVIHFAEDALGNVGGAEVHP